MTILKKPKITKRQALKKKMVEALNDEIKMLPVEMQDILVDDLITAFQNRMRIISEAKINFQYFVDVGVKVSQ
jgi:hypothetical protein